MLHMPIPSKVQTTVIVLGPVLRIQKTPYHENAYVIVNSFRIELDGLPFYDRT